MKKFIKEIVFFLIIGLVIGEIIARFFFLTPTIPESQIDRFGIQKYIPNQAGYWKGGLHKWQINEKGWPGKLPESFDNLVTIIGDSFIENFENPEECHQMDYLKKALAKYNYTEASRSGVSFIEALEISKQLDSLNPKVQLIYINETDFSESVLQIKRLPNITQMDLDNNLITYGKMKAPGLKKVLYSWKLAFYLYRRFQPSLAQIKPAKSNVKPNQSISDNFNHFEKLIGYARKNYNLEKIVIVLRPDTNKEFREFLKLHVLNVIQLDNSEDDNWSFEHDYHWTCYGHERASLQVVEYLKKL
ncbi:hypothetical protein [Flagellimonas sp. S3867]|uniref:hypothetical protein n=1 Tax=Flagellimonas sp. S3867 TaxID=2768063 RepID=UPI001683C889|nr:hypothetical protein [Flagellimonas sp. S3867]